METTKDYENKEFICIDDNSKEQGTSEYLQELKDLGWNVINQQDIRDQENEVKKNADRSNYVHMYAFSHALQIGLEKSTGDLIVPLQGDSQFIRKNWLQEYSSLFSNIDYVCAAGLDAQRKSRLESEYAAITSGDNNFFIHGAKIAGIVGAADCVYRKAAIEEAGGFLGCTEDDFVERFKRKHGLNKFRYFIPRVPVSAVINTDPRGTNARVRGNKRYGEYWRAQDDLYYKIHSGISDFITAPWGPTPIENIVVANGDWDLPIDKGGNWKKNPIDVENSEEYDII